LTLVVRDDQAKADVGVTNIRELIDNKDIIGFIGTANTAVGVQQAPIANQSKLPWLITVTTGSKVTQDPAVAPQYVFRVSMVDSEQAPFVAETVISKYKKIALIGDETGYGQLGIQDVTTALKAKNVDPIVTITYKNAGTSDEMKPMVQQIKASGADAIISWGLSAANANIRKAMKDLSVDLPFHGSWGISRPDYADLAGDLATGTIVPQTLSVDTKVQKQLDFFDKYRKKYNTQQVGFPSGLGQSYDGLWIMAIALRSLNGQETRDKLRDALESFGTYDGLVKKYDKPFANKFHEAFTKADFFFGVWKDGKIVRQS
jgi:branched-chain amino acid transport system substrate-binding protein